MSIDPLVVGGEIAQPDVRPWQVALVEAGWSAVDGQFCGGSLIDPEWVLTAAHCVQDEENGNILAPSEVDVIVGRYRLSSSAGQRLNVEYIFPHPDFWGVHGEGDGEEDIALLKLESPAILNESVQTIRLVEDASDPLIAPGVTAITTGWGLTIDNEDNSASDVLMQGEVPIVDNKTCQAVYDYDQITDVMLCAGGNETDSCQGDSGGPLVVPNRLGNGYLLAGVTSFGHDAGCGFPGTYGVYTRVPMFIEWIKSHVNVVRPPTPTPTVPPPQVIVAELYLPLMSR